MDSSCIIRSMGLPKPWAKLCTIQSLTLLLSSTGKDFCQDTLQTQCLWNLYSKLGLNAPIVLSILSAKMTYCSMKISTKTICQWETHFSKTGSDIANLALKWCRLCDLLYTSRMERAIPKSFKNATFTQPTLTETSGKCLKDLNITKFKIIPPTRWVKKSSTGATSTLVRIRPCTGWSIQILYHTTT